MSLCWKNVMMENAASSLHQVKRYHLRRTCIRSWFRSTWRWECHERLQQYFLASHFSSSGLLRRLLRAFGEKFLRNSTSRGPPTSCWGPPTSCWDLRSSILCCLSRATSMMVASSAWLFKQSRCRGSKTSIRTCAPYTARTEVIVACVSRADCAGLLFPTARFMYDPVRAPKRLRRRAQTLRTSSHRVAGGKQIGEPALLFLLGLL